MCDPKIIYRLAGMLVVLSVVLSFAVHPYWVALAVAVGLNLLQFSFSGFCPAERVFGHFRLLGCRPARGP